MAQSAGFTQKPSTFLYVCSSYFIFSAWTVAARAWSEGQGGGQVFHAGTKQVDETIVTDGGRVLGVTALGATIGDAVDEAYRGVQRIQWRGMQYRRDIGHRALARARE